MELVTVCALTAAKLVFRLLTHSLYQETQEDHRAAQNAYTYTRHSVLQEQATCKQACTNLAEARTEALDDRWIKLHTLLVACGVNGGLFAPPRRVFGQRSEADVQAILLGVQKLIVADDRTAQKRIRFCNRTVGLIQGFRCIDALDIVIVPALHENVGDICISMGIDQHSAVADALGGIWNEQAGEVLGVAMDIASIGISAAYLGSAVACSARTDQLNQATRRLEQQLSELLAANQRVDCLMLELESTSYELFKWTVLGDESAKIQRARRGRRRGVSDIPRWILRGLLRRATELWSTCGTPVFPS
jgi:hypothetical protein